MLLEIETPNREFLVFRISYYGQLKQHVPECILIQKVKSCSVEYFIVRFTRIVILILESWALLVAQHHEWLALQKRWFFGHEILVITAGNGVRDEHFVLFK